MKTIMKLEDITTVAQLTEFLTGTQSGAFTMLSDKDACYRWLQGELVKFRFLGLSMDQDGDGTGGEAVADQVTVSFDIGIADVVIDEDLTISESDPSYRDKVIVVRDATVTVDGSYDFKGMDLRQGAVLTSIQAQNDSSPKPRWSFGQLIVDYGALIDVSGLGLPPNADVSLNAGGSFGGTGSAPANGKTNAAFGSEFEPNDFGIGGRGSEESLVSYGGGALRLIAGELVLDGDIRANGGAALTDTAGASGGALWLEAENISGSGKITANGSSGNQSSGHGGGGRISLTYREITGFNVEDQLSVKGGYEAPEAYRSIYVHQSGAATRVRALSLEPITAASDGWISVEFSEELEAASFSAYDIQLTDGNGNHRPTSAYQ